MICAVIGFFAQAEDLKQLSVGIDLTYAPYAYLDNGVASGFDPDFTALLAKEMGLEADYKDTRIENIIIGLNAQHYDLVASALYINPQRAKQVDFIPYLQTGGVLVTRKEDRFLPKSLYDLCGNSISSMKGASWIPALNEVSDQYCQPQGLGRIIVKEYPSAPEAAQALLSKGVDVQYEDAAVAKMVMDQLGDRLLITTDEMIDPVLIGLAFNKDQSLLKAKVISAIERLKNSGEYEALLQKYNLEYPSVKLLQDNAAFINSSMVAENAAIDKGFKWGYLGSLFLNKNFWKASLTVIELSTLTWTISLILGFMLAIAGRSKSRMIVTFAATYIWFFRSLPLLVLLIFIYNLPQFWPASSILLSSAFIAGLIALVLSESAYMAEIHRGALQAIPQSQTEAGKALGLSFLGMQMQIIIPQAFRVALPALANQYVTIVKLTSLVSVISLTEILLVGQQLYTRNFLVMETLLAVAFYYVLIVSMVTWLLKQLEKRLDVSSREESETIVRDNDIFEENLISTTFTTPNDTGRYQSEFAIEVHKASKSYGKQPVFTALNLAIEWGKVTTIIGPSGSGKTTLLKSMNGLEELDEGVIQLAGSPFIYGRKERSLSLKADYHRRLKEIGMVFQNFNLFPHKTILENIMLAPIFHKMGPFQSLREEGLGYLEKVGLLAHAHKYPHQLSGGQQQRAAIARALAMKPSILLFDEPTSALDPELVNDVLQVIAALADDGITIIMVTHEVSFALNISDRIIFMDDGIMIHDGTPNEIKASKDKRLQRFIDQNSHGQR